MEENERELAEGQSEERGLKEVRETLERGIVRRKMKIMFTQYRETSNV